MARDDKPSRLGNWITFISLLILVGAELYGIAFAGAWAVAGLFEFGDVLSTATYGVFGLIGTWGLYAFGKRAYGMDDLGRGSSAG
jgi:hypothetical protein